MDKNNWTARLRALLKAQTPFQLQGFNCQGMWIPSSSCQGVGDQTPKVPGLTSGVLPILTIESASCGTKPNIQAARHMTTPSAIVWNGQKRRPQPSQRRRRRPERSGSQPEADFMVDDVNPACPDMSYRPCYGFEGPVKGGI